MDPKPARASEEHEDAEVLSWVAVCPRGLWRVQQRFTHKSISTNNPASHQCPRLGSVCQVRVQLQKETSSDQSAPEDKAKTNPRCLSTVLQIPLGEWTTVRIGEGHCDVSEACLERMSTGDKCELHLSPLQAGSEVAADMDQFLHATVDLQTFTPGKESWELSPGEKMEWVKFHKENGGFRFRSGDVWGAADSYSRALKLMITLYGQVKEAETKGQKLEAEGKQPRTDSGLPSAKEYRTIKAELHSNMSLCQLKLKQPECARASAFKATELEPTGAKAWYRLGQACQMISDLEEAKKAFKKLLELQPDSSSAIKALKDVAVKEKETNKQLGHRLSKMFS